MSSTPALSSPSLSSSSSASSFDSPGTPHHVQSAFPFPLQKQVQQRFGANGDLLRAPLLEQKPFPSPSHCLASTSLSSTFGWDEEQRQDHVGMRPKDTTLRQAEEEKANRIKVVAWQRRTFFFFDDDHDDQARFDLVPGVVSTLPRHGGMVADRFTVPKREGRRQRANALNVSVEQVAIQAGWTAMQRRRPLRMPNAV